MNYKKILLGGMLITLLASSSIVFAQNYQTRKIQEADGTTRYIINYKKPSPASTTQAGYYAQHYQPREQLLPPARVQSPAQLLEQSIKKVIHFLSQPKEDASLEQITAFLQQEITPHFDFDYMSRWVAGRYFKAMSAEQQKTFTQTFSELFITTFVQKLSNYQNYPPVVDDFRSKRTGKNEALATARILQETGGYIQVDFKFLKTSKGWKVVDVKANGISALYYYRNYFADQIRKRQQQQAVFK